MKKKILSMALALVMCLSLMPTVALAAEGTAPTEDEVSISTTEVDFGEVVQSEEVSLTETFYITNHSDRTVYVYPSFGDGPFYIAGPTGLSRDHHFWVDYDEVWLATIAPGETFPFEVDMVSAKAKSAKFPHTVKDKLEIALRYGTRGEYLSYFVDVSATIISDEYINDYDNDSALSVESTYIDLGVLEPEEDGCIRYGVEVTNNSPYAMEIWDYSVLGRDEWGMAAANRYYGRVERADGTIGDALLQPGESCTVRLELKKVYSTLGARTDTLTLVGWPQSEGLRHDSNYSGATVHVTVDFIVAEDGCVPIEYDSWADVGGKIEPVLPYLGNNMVPVGEDFTVYFTPNDGWYVKDVKFKKGRLGTYESVGPCSSYTFSNVDDWYYIEADFEQGIAPVVEQPSSWAVSFVDQAKTAGIVPEALQSKYTQSITRAEYCALATALYESIKGEVSERKTFTDTADVNVEKMAAIGVVSGVGDNKFSPDSKLTREQAAVMLSRLAEALGNPFPDNAPTFADNSNISSWAFNDVGRVQANGIMSGVGNNNFSPKTDYTREQSIITMVRMMEHAK